MKLITLLTRWVNIVVGRNRVSVKQGEGKLYSKTEIKGYYNDLTGKVNNQTLLDKNGIPINIIAGGEKVYFPIAIFQYALGLYDLFLESNSDVEIEHFLKICDWVIDHQEENGSWNCFGPIGYKKLTVSSMGQGEAISVLLRAYTQTKEDKWLKSAQNAIKFMMIDVCSGGTLLRENEDVVFEEYASVDGEKKSVLNGWIFSLFGLYDYLKIVSDEKIQNIYIKSLDTLEKNLSCYDNGYWSLYDRTGRLASPAYNDLHICLLNVLSDITNRDSFKHQAEVFSKYEKSIFNTAKAILIKIVQKLRESPEGIVVK